SDGRAIARTPARGADHSSKIALRPNPACRIGTQQPDIRAGRHIAPEVILDRQSDGIANDGFTRADLRRLLNGIPIERGAPEIDDAEGQQDEGGNDKGELDRVAPPLVPQQVANHGGGIPHSPIHTSSWSLTIGIPSPWPIHWRTPRESE